MYLTHNRLYSFQVVCIIVGNYLFVGSTLWQSSPASLRIWKYFTDDLSVNSHDRFVFSFGKKWRIIFLYYIYFRLNHIYSKNLFMSQCWLNHLLMGTYERWISDGLNIWMYLLTYLLLYIGSNLINLDENDPYVHLSQNIIFF